MTWIPIAAALFLIAHGIGHAIWFAGAWVPSTRLVTVGGSLLPGHERITSAIGKAFGMASLIAMAGFIAAGWALLAQQQYWQAYAIMSALLSLAAVIPWWNESPRNTVLSATIADLAIIATVILPFGERLAG